MSEASSVQTSKRNFEKEPWLYDLPTMKKYYADVCDELRGIELRDNLDAAMEEGQRTQKPVAAFFSCYEAGRMGAPNYCVGHYFMRVRMLHAGTIDLLNRETCPVYMNYSLGGFPDLPAFRDCNNETLPWFRVNAAHYSLMDPWGQELFGGAFELIGRRIHSPLTAMGLSYDDDPWSYDGLVNGLERFRRFKELSQRDQRDANLASDREQFEKDLRTWQSEALIPFREHQVWTAMLSCDFIGSNPWQRLNGRFAHPGEGKPETLAPGVRAAVIRACARVVTDLSPLSPYAREVFNRHYERWLSANPDDPSVSAAQRFAGDHNDSSPFPYVVRFRNARAIENALGRPLCAPDADPVAAVKKWYATAKNDPSLEIKYSDDPALRYAFAREPYSES